MVYEKKFSWKKFMGISGGMMMHFIGAYAVHREPATVGAVLLALSLFDGGCLAIKTAGIVAGNKLRDQNG